MPYYPLESQERQAKIKELDKKIHYTTLALGALIFTVVISFATWSLLDVKCFFVSQQELENIVSKEQLAAFPHPECIENAYLKELREKIDKERKESRNHQLPPSMRNLVDELGPDAAAEFELRKTALYNKNPFSVMPIKKYALYQSLEDLAESGEYDNITTVSEIMKKYPERIKRVLLSSRSRSDHDEDTTRSSNSNSHLVLSLSKKNLLRSANVFHDSMLAVKDHKISYDEPTNGRLYCELALLQSGHCFDFETAPMCIDRVGSKKLDLALPIRCSKNSWFQMNFIEYYSMFSENNKKMNNSNSSRNNNNTKKSTIAAMDPEVIALRRAEAPLRRRQQERASSLLLSSRRRHENGNKNKNMNSILMKRKEIFSAASWQQESALDDKTNLVISAGKLVDSQMQPQKPSSYIPKEKRTYANMPPPQNWTNNCNNCSKMYRLPMAIPEEAIAEKVQRDKLFDFNPLMPVMFPTWLAKKSTYGLGRHDEAVIREILSRSFFSWTHRRGCWSAQRHLDILAAGSVPFFPDLLACKRPEICLPNYPVDLVKRALNLSGVKWMIEPDYRPDRRYFPNNNSVKVPVKKFPASYFIRLPIPYNHGVYNPMRPGIIKHRDFNLTEYFFIAEELLAYTKKHLTTKAVAAYFLKVMNAEDAKAVFATSYWWLPNSVGLIHGLTSLGVHVYSNGEHGFPRVPFNSTEEQRAKRRSSNFPIGWRGAGHLYGMRTDPTKIHSCGEPENIPKCLALAKKGVFEVYMYCVSGNLNKMMYYEEWVKDNVAPEKVALMDGLDQASTFCQDDYKMYCGKGHKMFTREPYVEIEPVRQEYPPNATENMPGIEELDLSGRFY